MRIASVASAFPKNYYQQDELVAALKLRWAKRLHNPQLLDRLRTRACVDGRHLALPIDRYDHIRDWGEANSLWIEHSLELGQQALSGALARADLAPSDLSALFMVSITGIANPSIDARLVNRMGLSTNLKRIPIFGLGCVAGAAGIARAADYVKAYPDEVAAVLSVELCSLTIQLGDLSVANAISAVLFGDGAAAVLVSGSARDHAGPKILATRSIFYPDSEYVMGWDICAEGFKVVLSPDVPMIVERHLAGDVDAFLHDQGLCRARIGSWILHTGGPKVLEATAAALELPDAALNVSWECLRKTGNLSSASVLVVLEEVIQNRRPAPGTLSLLAAMGPGFCSELVLLKW
ncbi:MAG: type III polyketide synthase [Acidobacteriota bacterium]|nr:type III polyketide synthase [Acidobacteriota bacterium]